VLAQHRLRLHTDFFVQVSLIAAGEKRVASKVPIAVDNPKQNTSNKNLYANVSIPEITILEHVRKLPERELMHDFSQEVAAAASVLVVAAAPFMKNAFGRAVSRNTGKGSEYLFYYYMQFSEENITTFS